MMMSTRGFSAFLGTRLKIYWREMWFNLGIRGVWVRFVSNLCLAKIIILRIRMAGYQRSLGPNNISPRIISKMRDTMAINRAIMYLSKSDSQSTVSSCSNTMKNLYKTTLMGTPHRRHWSSLARSLQSLKRWSCRCTSAFSPLVLFAAIINTV